MLKRFQIRLYPTKEQEVLLDRHVNAYRFLYNLCLEYKIEMYKYYGINKSGYDMQKELFEIIKTTDWLKGLKVECLRDAALNVDKTFKKFFKGQSKYPKFKNKKSRKSFTANQSIAIKCNKLHFFKNLIKFKTSDRYEEILKDNKIKQCTFYKDTSGKWFASCLVDSTITKTIPTTDKKIGIDLGIKNFITTSDGNFISNPNFFKKSEKKLKRIQKQFSKTKKCGSNREKLRIKLSKVHNKVYNQKQHFFHQVSNKLILENQEIFIEDLRVNKMLKNKKLSKAISEGSWRMFRNILEYKCIWYGRKLVVCDTYFASSKACSNCGNIKQDLKLSDRTYKCRNCNTEIDRDINAAINLVNYNPTVKNTGSQASGDFVRPISG